MKPGRSPAQLLILLATALLGGPIHAQISFTGSYAQDFDSLATTGTNDWTNGSTLDGWFLFRQPEPGTAVANYTAGNGSSSTGAFYSFGSVGSGERALGGLGSGGSYFGNATGGSVAGWIALGATNNTGGSIQAIGLAYRGEQWRNGNNTNSQTMVFEYGIGASFGTVALWNTPGGLFDWASPVNTTTAGPLDGNVAGLVSGLGGTLGNLSWNNGETLWLRWIERNDAGNDHGLALDDFSLVVIPEPSVMLSLVAGFGLLALLRHRPG